MQRKQDAIENVYTVAMEMLWLALYRPHEDWGLLPLPVIKRAHWVC